MVEVIKVIDLTDVPIHMKEILFAKVLDVNEAGKLEVFQIAQVFNVQVADIGNDSVLLECKLTERRNNELIALLKSQNFPRDRLSRVVHGDLSQSVRHAGKHAGCHNGR